MPMKGKSYETLAVILPTYHLPIVLALILNITTFISKTSQQIFSFVIASLHLKNFVTEIDFF